MSPRHSDTVCRLKVALPTSVRPYRGTVYTSHPTLVGRQKTHLEQQQTLLEAERRSHHAVRTSWSWRLTAPVRRLIDRLKNVGG